MIRHIMQGMKEQSLNLKQIINRSGKNNLSHQAKTHIPTNPKSLLYFHRYPLPQHHVKQKLNLIESMKPSQSSASRLLNKKLSISSANTPKYVQSKIYITTKQLHDPSNNSSIKKAIDTKLDLIKQEISREISQHYNRKLSRQNSKNHEISGKRNESSTEKRPRKGSKSRPKSEINPLSSSNSRVMTPYNKFHDIQAGSKAQEQNFHPRRLFEQEIDTHEFGNMTRQLAKSSNSTNIMGSSISKLNLLSSQYPNIPIHDYKEKFLIANEKYLDQKGRGIDCQGQLLRLKSSIESFAIRPDDTTLHVLLREFTHPRFARGDMSNQEDDPNDYDRLQKHEDQGMVHSHNDMSQRGKVEEGLRYLLTCFEDIEEFKLELQHLLQLTGTASLEQLKDVISYKFSHHKPMPQSMDEFTYRFLELESANQRIKSEYEKIIEDMREKTELEVYNIKKSHEKQIEKVKKAIKQVEDQLSQKQCKYELVIGEIGKMGRKCVQHIQHIQQEYMKTTNAQGIMQPTAINHFKKENHEINKEKDESDRIFGQKMKKLSEFNLYSRQASEQQLISPQHTKPHQQVDEFTPKYSFKLSKSSSLQPESACQSMKAQNKEASIEQRLQLPDEVKSLEEIFAYLLERVMEINEEAGENMEKLRQANEAISAMDSKIYEIKYELQDQIKEHENSVSEKTQVIGQLSAQIKQLQERDAKMIEDASNYVQTLKGKQTQIQRLARELQHTKKEMFDNNNKTIQLFASSCSIDDQKKSILEFLQEELYSFGRKIAKIDLTNTHLHRQSSVTATSSSIPPLESSPGNRTFAPLPELPVALSRFFTQISSTVEDKLTKTQEYHKLFVHKQKECFELMEKVKQYQKNILTLQKTLNDTILEKQEYEYLLTELRQEHSLYQKQKDQEIKHIEKKKDHELIIAHKTILEQNQKLNSEIIEEREENTRLNKQLQEKINERTIYRRKATQTEALIQEKDMKILGLEKDCNSYKIHLEEIEKSFDELVKNDKFSSQKIISLSQENTSLKQENAQLQKMSKALQKENTQYREGSNSVKMQMQALSKKLNDYQQSKEAYEKLNIDLRMKNIELQQTVNEVEQECNKLKKEWSQDKKMNEKLQRINNELTINKEELSAVIGLKAQKHSEQLQKYKNLEISYQMLKNDLKNSQQPPKHPKQGQQKDTKSHLTQRQAFINRKERQLQQKQQQIQSRQKQIEQKQRLIGQRENNLSSQESLLIQSQKQLSQKQQMAQKTKSQYDQKLLYLELRVKSIDTEQLIHKEQLTVQQSSLEAQLQQLKQRQSRFIEEQHKYESQLRESSVRQEELTRKEVQLCSLEQALTRRQELLDGKGRDLDQKEKRLNIKDSSIKQRQSHLSQLQQLLNQKQLSLTLKQQELEQIKKQILETQSLLQKQASSITIKQNELLSQQNQLGLKSSQMNDREKSLQTIEYELKLAQTQIRMREKQLEQRQKVICQKGKELTEELVAIKQHEAQPQLSHSLEQQQQKQQKESQVNIQNSSSSQPISFNQFLTPSQSESHSFANSSQQNRPNPSRQKSHSPSHNSSLSSQKQNQNGLKNDDRIHPDMHLEDEDRSQSIGEQEHAKDRSQSIGEQIHAKDIILMTNSNGSPSEKLEYAVTEKKSARALSQKIKNLFTPEGDANSQNQDNFAQDLNPMNLAQLYSENKLPSLLSHNDFHDKPDERWVSEINFILTALLEPQTQNHITGFTYFDSIKDNYTKLLSRQLRTVAPLTLDLSEIDFRNSVSSPLSFSGNKLFGLRFNSDIDNTDQKDKEDFKQTSKQKQKEDPFKLQRSKTDHQNSLNDMSIVTQKLKIEHLSQVKLLLFNKLEEKQTENETLRSRIKQLESQTLLTDQIQELQSKLYAFEAFQNLQNDEMKVGVLWNLFKQLLTSYNEEQFYVKQSDLEKFERICRILFKMLKYPQKQIDLFDIQCENRKKQKKVPSFFTRLTRSMSQQKKDPKASISPLKK